MSANRLYAIDATRGTAMLFACLAHFAWTLEGYDDRTAEISVLIGMVATPTFLIVSGTMLGMLYVRAGARFPAVRRKLVDRGLFLLTVGHVLIAIAFAYPFDATADSLRRIFITDAIGFAVVVGAASIAWLGVAACSVIGFTLFAASWIVVSTSAPDSFTGLLAKQALVGLRYDEHHVLISASPLLPYLGMYLAAVPLGAWLARADSDDPLPGRTLFLLGAGAIAGAVALKAGYLVSRPQLGAFRELVYLLTEPRQKVPPSIAYTLFYGGSGLAIAGVLWLTARRRTTRWLVTSLSYIGQASLFVFVLQFYLYLPIAAIVGTSRTPYWPVFLLASILCVWFAARAWAKRGLNRVLTVGFSRGGARSDAL